MSADRKQILTDFENGKYNVLCNSMLLTEGWDCPSVDCVIVLRPTKVRSLYSQMVGRGTRPAPNKKDLLLLDFLWHTSRHELCRPACLIAESADIAEQMTENIAAAGCPVDITDAEITAQEDVVTKREEALAKKLEEMKNRDKRLVDPLKYVMSIQFPNTADFASSFGNDEQQPPTDEQAELLRKFGVNPSAVDSAEKAKALIDSLSQRQQQGLASAKQIRTLEQKGFKNVASWSFEAANRMLKRIAAAGWKTIPRGIDPATYVPPMEVNDIGFDWS